MRVARFGVIAGLVLILATTAWAGSIPAGYTCNGTCGSLGADGVVPLSPTGNSAYLYITTNGGTTGVGALPTGKLGGETDGSTLTTPIFSATAGNPLNFYFDYVTSDGAGYADYAWAELETSTGTPVALLFSARTVPSPGNIVPGTGMPAPSATLNPSTVSILSGTTWSPLGSWSGACFASGCGNSGWVDSTYTIATTGDYILVFGTTNWGDQIYDSGMAIDGVTVAGVPVGPPPTSTTPEPSSLLLMGTGLVSVLGAVRRKLGV